MDFLNFFKKKDKINKIYLVAKITNYEIFDEQFMPLPGGSRVQPHWEYFADKGVIKIDLNQDIVNFLNQSTFDYTLDELFKLKNNQDFIITVDIPLFKEFSELFIYVHYSLNGQDFINFYSQNDLICLKDFKIRHFKNEFKFAQLHFGLINLDITDYLKLFSNNKKEVTQELLLLNYNIDANLEKVNLKLI
jgi:hypothetical protein